MASSDGHANVPVDSSKTPSGLVSFLHRSGGRLLPSSPLSSLHDGAMAADRFANDSPGALGELQQNHWEPPPHRPTYSWGDVSLRPVADTGSPSKPKKQKSGTNLVGLLARPKSLKNLYRLAADDDMKENRKPAVERCSVDGLAASARPPSAATARLAARAPRGRVLDAFSALTHAARFRSPADPPPLEYPDHILHPRDIDGQLEDLLERRNIPENQRYKMRNLSDTIKIEFIRQDWAEMHARRPAATPAASSPGPGPGSDCDDKPKRSRGRSFTFSRAKKDARSPSKKPKPDGSLVRRHHTKSVDSLVPNRPSLGPSSASALLSKIKLQQGPADYVAYLHRVPEPERVEVDKLHKLRLLLRNETVAWIEDFIQQGGIREIVGLLNRIVEVEWREDHEDALLHENLLCLKALSTTSRAIEYLDSVQADLFHRLLHLLFDPDKGPSEFTTRNIVTSLLLTYIESAAPPDRVARAAVVLTHLRDPEPREEERPLPFVLEMRRERPYRVWCKEVVSVSKEVFWIFLHNLNVVALPSDKDPETPPPAAALNDATRGPYSYMLRHFPPERPPVPTAPYVGGVEWDATNYLASHLDLMNSILACTPTPDERNALRSSFRISGWERCLGGSLRLCKEKFYGAVHTALRTWVAAAAEDGWEVRDVRFGPSPETRKSPAKPAAARGPKPKTEEPPRLDMPKLDFEPAQPRDG